MSVDEFVPLRWAHFDEASSECALRDRPLITNVNAVWKNRVLWAVQRVEANPFRERLAQQSTGGKKTVLLD